jgi:CMD domain protein
MMVIDATGESMSTVSTTSTDVVNAILGVDENSPIVALRNQKPTLVSELQDYYDSLFLPDPESAAAFPLADRFVVAIRVASFTGSSAVAQWYTDLATSAGVDTETLKLARDTSSEWTGSSSLDAAIRHTDLLTSRPSEASPVALQALKDAGFSPAGIVSLSQTVAFVSYQLRLIAGLRALGGLA